MRITVPFFDNRTGTATPLPSDRVPETLKRAAADPNSAGLRILHILRAPMGGLFRHVCDLIEEQARMGHEVGIVCDSSTGGDTVITQLEKIAPWCRLGICRLPMSRTISFGDAVTLAKIGRHVARIAPHVLHGHGAKGGAYARLLPRMKGRVALYTPHGGALHYSWKSPAGALFLALERALMLRSDGILFESQYGQRVYSQKVGKARCPMRVVHNGLSQADFAPPTQAEPEYDAVFIGELRTLKGVATLIDAVAQISRDRPFKLGIAGTGPNEWRFKAQAAARGMEKLIDFLGHRPAREMFARGRTIVVPSLAESFPYIVLEAVASGKPVIATDVGGISEIFGPHADHLLKAGDVDALAQAIRTALEQPEPGRARQGALLDRARKMFSAPRMARDITRFYGDLREPGPAVERPLADPVKVPETTAI